MKNQVKFECEGEKFILFQDHNGLYVLGFDVGDDKVITYQYRAIDLQDLILQYPFIKQAAKHFKFDEEMQEIING